MRFHCGSIYLLDCSGRTRLCSRLGSNPAPTAQETEDGENRRRTQVEDTSRNVCHLCSSRSKISWKMASGNTFPSLSAVERFSVGEKGSPPAHVVACIVLAGLTLCGLRALWHLGPRCCLVVSSLLDSKITEGRVGVQFGGGFMAVSDKFQRRSLRFLRLARQCTAAFLLLS